ncbi:MAG: hypothetical protein CL792_03025 [Chloroflexi bacterium]|nr:hypothetical protein [Chloroflexota bacterium]|tara:strand:+ start:22965 stop:23378 length:414 start_codon:yes stop_codon:yes gene_type:complete
MPDRSMPQFPEPDTSPFWESVKNEQLSYQQCNVCNTVVFYPRYACSSCGSGELVWKDSKGEGEIYTYSVVRQNRNPAFADLGAYVLAYVDLDEGFRMMTNVVGIKNPLTDIKIGQRVKVKFEKQESGEFPVPVFELI